jgi:hypothetical protein
MVLDLLLPLSELVELSNLTLLVFSWAKSKSWKFFFLVEEDESQKPQTK